MQKPFVLCLVLLSSIVRLAAQNQTRQSSVPDSSSAARDIAPVVVNGTRRSANPTQVEHKLSQEAIHHSLGQPLATLLEAVGGMSSVRTGTTLAKPVLHGMYGNRLLIINDGALITSQQWGNDHAPEVDQNASRLVRVVKGAQSVRYGSEALGGVVLLESAPLPFGGKLIEGSVGALYATNGRQAASNLYLQGCLPKYPSFAYRLQSSFENSGDRHSAAYMLNNSGTRAKNVSAAIGWQRTPFDATFNYKYVDQSFGVLRAAQMGNEDLLAQRIAIGQPLEVEPFSRQIDVPYQRVQHHTAALKMHHAHPRWGCFQWQSTWQHNARREYRLRRQFKQLPAVELLLHSWQHELQWEKTYGRWHSDVGVKQMSQSSYSRRGTGVVPIIPNYNQQNYGLFAVQQYRGTRWGSELGLRGDYQRLQADGYDWMGERYGGTHRYGNLSVLAAAYYLPLDGVKLTTSAGLAWRAPHVFELYSNGNDLGSGYYLRGDANLRPERGYKWVGAAAYRNARLQLKLEAFVQWVERYIYDEPTQARITVLSGTYPLFQYKQTNAFFRGADFEMKLTPLSWLRYQLQASLIFANERGTGRYLPFMPAPRLTQGLNITPWQDAKWHFSFGLNHRFVAKQRRFDAATDLLSDSPAAYHLLGAEIALKWQMTTTRSMTLRLQGDNLTNKLYKEYTNRARYYAHDLGRDVRLLLYFNF